MPIRPSIPPSIPDAASVVAPDTVCQILASHRYNIQDELSLQDGIDSVFKKAGLTFRREAALDAHNRPDFMVGKLAVEVKIKGTFAQFLRQAQRYAELDQVDAVIVVGTPKWMPLVPSSLNGKPVFTVRLLNSLL